MSEVLAIIGGSGFVGLNALSQEAVRDIDTPFGKAAVVEGQLGGHKILFMLRHGAGHKLPPHRVNYRANIWALKQLGATYILAVNAVGGIRADMVPGAIAVPHQIIDYTHGRDSTFFDDGEKVVHIDFTFPFSEDWRQLVLKSLTSAGINLVGDGVYACTQGPRLETAAEIERLRRDGCDMVGMTAMPEAALASELELKYASVAIVVNWAAGLSDQPITMQSILDILDVKIHDLQSALPTLLLALNVSVAKAHN